MMLKEKPTKASLKELEPSEISRLSKTKGTYTLVIFVPVETWVAIGSLGKQFFSRGYYAYTGSAFGNGALSLGGRIRRHLRKADKKKRWHIDHLLSMDKVKVTSVIAAHTKKKMECEVNRFLKKELSAEIPVLGFGSSDCKENCESHLLYLGLDDNIAERIAELYSKKVGDEIYLFDFT